MVTTAGVEESPRLRQERAAAGLSQKELAALSGVSVRTIRGMESSDAARPRPQSVQRLATALGLVGDRRAEFLAHWDVVDQRRGIAADELMLRPQAFADLLADVRQETRTYHMEHAQVTAQVGLNRRIESELIERVVVADQGGVAGVPLVLDTSSVPHPDRVRVQPLGGCVVVEETDFAAERSKVVRLGFGRSLAGGALQSFRVRVSYRFDPDPGPPPQPPESSRQIFVGLHHAALLCVVRVQFRPQDRPLACREVSEERLGSGIRELGPAWVDPHGMAQVAVVRPGPGWYGLSWTW